MPRPVSLDRDLAAAVARAAPAHLDAAAVGRVAHRVADQVGDARSAARSRCRRSAPRPARSKTIACRPADKRARLGLDLRRTGAPTATQRSAVGRGLPSSCASVSRSPTSVGHALGLLRHQRAARASRSTSVSGRLRIVSRKPDEHRQRRADLVRDVGDEVAPHRLGALALGHVLRQHELGMPSP